MSICLLLGTGINRCQTSDISWKNLMQEIKNNYNGVYINDNISFPMQFENIANKILSLSHPPSDEIYSILKEYIINYVNDKFNQLDHKLHLNLASIADSIITTNYDFEIEKALDLEFDPKQHGEINSNKYNINCISQVKNKQIHHIHGNIKHARSICLGYEHYSGTLQHLRSALTTRDKDNHKPNIIRFLEGSKSDLKTWAVRFFTDDIHIIGFGLDQSEIDLWWLITYRAYLYYTNIYNARDLIKNTIIYHDVSDKKDENMKYALEHNAVKYEFYDINQETGQDNKNAKYMAAYTKIAEKIRSNTIIA